MNLYNFVLENLVLPAGDWVLGTQFIAQLKLARKIQHFSRNELVSYESDMLQKLLIHISTNVDYYKKLNVHSADDPVAWLKNFPILYKNTIKENATSMIFKDGNKLIAESSSGSSGVQVTVYMSAKESSRTQAWQTLLWEWGGFKLGNRFFQLGMTTRRPMVKKIKDILLRTYYQQAFNISRVEVEKSLTKKIDFTQCVMGGYASGLYGYALYARDMKLKVNFKSVVSWGDKMFPHYRKLIKEVFGAPVTDTYGSTEGFVIAGQCEFQNYHVLSPHVYLELLDKEGKEVRDGEPGYVVVTRLDGYSMPLIRYYLGDIAVKEAKEVKCACGRELPMIRQIVGRDTDIVRTRSGKLLIVHFFTGIFEHFEKIRQFRVIQQDLDSIIIEYIPEIDFSPYVLEEVRSVIVNKLEEQFEIEFQEVQHIEPTASGKPQIIKSLIND
ncbi:MAG: phenylacetate--CoA ligase family protein [Cyclobacteriaceae bacterium]|nr:phenylacetate--CoA ligase family protein [Cyclobacteriaceae bacterium]